MPNKAEIADRVDVGDSVTEDDSCTKELAVEDSVALVTSTASPVLDGAEAVVVRMLDESVVE